MLEVADDYQKMIDLQKQIEEVAEKLDAKTEEWMELVD